MRLTITVDDDARAAIADAMTAGAAGEYAPAGVVIDRLFPELRGGTLPASDPDFGTGQQMYFVLRGLFAINITAP